MFRLDDQVVAVIGAASGIGEAVALAASEQGARVVALDVNEEGLKSVSARIIERGGRAEFFSLDIRDGSAVEKVFADIGKLDGVVSTPSINVRKRILDYSDEELDRVLDVNLNGSFHVLQAAGRVMSMQGRGSIIVFSSIRSLVVEPGQAVYAATKAGIVQMVRTLACELGGSRERCGPGGRRDTTDGAHSSQAGVVSGLRGEKRFRAMGASGREGGAHGVSSLRCRELCDGNRAVRRWRVDSRRWPFHASIGCAVESRLLALLSDHAVVNSGSKHAPSRCPTDPVIRGTTSTSTEIS